MGKPHFSSTLQRLHRKEKFMRKITIIFLTISALMMVGCTGTLYTVKDAKLKVKKDGAYLKGVTAYPPRLFVEVYETTAYIDKGKILRTAAATDPEKKCTPLPKHTVVTKPDYNAPYQIFYDPGFLESNKFGVGLKDGMLTAVNTESIPDRGETLKNITSAAANVAGIVSPTLVADEIIACNDRPVLLEVLPYDDWTGMENRVK